MDNKVAALVGVPYEKMNCWELTQAFYKITFDLELKNFASDPKDRSATQNLIFTNKGEFQQVTDTPRYGDIVILKVRGLESHIAVYMGEGLMLHTTSKTGSVIDRTERWVKTIVGYYRPKIGSN